MSRQLINLSPDLKRLSDEGYDIEIKAGFLLVHSVPYLNANQELCSGTLVSTLSLAGDITTVPSDHVVHFIGEYPHQKGGGEITQIKHANETKSISEGTVINFSFSNKPAGGYANYHAKMTRYIDIITAEAESAFPLSRVTAKSFKPIEGKAEHSVFQYLDSSSSRGGFQASSQKLVGLKVGIIGLGGTGSYILDLIAKTPIAEIHLFDDDHFLQHNAFRSPGAASLYDLKAQLIKVDYYQKAYSKLHKNIFAHPLKVTESNAAEMAPLDFVFICVDSASSRQFLVRKLEEMQISFIDVGMGIVSVNDMLIGQVRTTISTASTRDSAIKSIPLSDTENDNEYATNIQICELNALNACMAVMKWKKQYGFYQDLENEICSIYELNTNLIVNLNQ